MNPIARRLLRAAAAAVARKLLPDAVPDNPGSALALRPSDRQIEVFPPVDRQSSLAPLSNSFPTARTMQTLCMPPPAPVQTVDAPAPHRRRRVVVTETFYIEETEW